MSFSIRQTLRQQFPNTAALVASLTPEQVADFGSLTNEDTISTLDVISRDSGSVEVVLTIQVVHNRGSTTKRQLLAKFRNKATVANDARLVGPGGEETLVGVELPL